MTKLCSCCDSRVVRCYHSYLHGHANYNFLLMIMWYNYTSTNYVVFLCSVPVISVNNYSVFKVLSLGFLSL